MLQLKSSIWKPTMRIVLCLSTVLSVQDLSQGFLIKQCSGSASRFVSNKHGSGSIPFLIKSVERTEKMVAKSNFNTKIFLLKI